MRQKHGTEVPKPVAPRGSARERVIESALALFTVHGVNGTSLQMIADHIGVSKAAVYYQFHSKDDIALAVVRPVFDDLARLVRIVEGISPAEAQRDAAISGLIELSVHHRRTTAVFHGDPVIEELVRSHREFEDVILKMQSLLVGPDPGTRRRVAVAMLMAGIFIGATNPDLHDVADTDLHRAMLECSRNLFGPVNAPGPSVS